MKFVHFTIIAAVTTTGLLLLLVILIVVITSIVCAARVAMRQKQHNIGLVLIIVIVQYYRITTGVIDHVPVDDNPAYITMKRITLNKNTAYETVNMKDCHYETVNTSHYENVKQAGPSYCGQTII